MAKSLKEGEPSRSRNPREQLARIKTALINELKDEVELDGALLSPLIISQLIDVLREAHEAQQITDDRELTKQLRKIKAKINTLRRRYAYILSLFKIK